MSKQTFKVRWAIKRDLPEMLDTDVLYTGPSAWSEEKVRSELSAKNGIGMVVEDTSTEEVHGFTVYRLHKHHITVHKLVGSVEVQSLMVANIIGKIDRSLKRVFAYFIVKEDDLPTQMLLKECGLRCVGLRNGEMLFRYFHPKTQFDVVA